MDENLYLDFILEHYKNPRNFGTIEHAQVDEKGSNSSCGDEIELFLKINNNVVEDVKFYGKGCAISQASASILTELIKGKTIEELNNFKSEDLLKELGITLTPVRLKCALLSYEVLKRGLEKYRK
ncbi:MAG: SUF system NifU family Fe-S cluster assembly protein [Thermoplasmata archaeon]